MYVRAETQSHPGYIQSPASPGNLHPPRQGAAHRLLAALHVEYAVRADHANSGHAALRRVRCGGLPGQSQEQPRRTLPKHAQILAEPLI